MSRTLQPLLSSGIGILALLSVPLQLKNPTSLDDTLRHLTMARLLALRGTTEIQGWGDFLYAGYFAEHNIDPWFLTHRLLMPIARLPMEQAQEVFIATMIVIMSATFLFVLKHLKVSGGTVSILTLLLLLGHVQFSMRLLLGRPVFLMVAITMLAVLAILKRRWIGIGLLTIVALLLSHLFVFPLAVVAIGCLWYLTLGEGRNAVATGIASLAGVAIGLSIHPDGLEYLSYLVTVFFKLPFLKTLNVSTEMHTGFGRMASVIALLGLVMLLLVTMQRKHQTTLKDFHEQGISFLSAVVLTFTLGMLLWVRMIDFLWPVALILLAAVLPLESKPLRKTMEQLLPNVVLKPSTLLIVLAVILTLNTLKLHHEFGSQDSNHSLAAFSSSLEGIPPGSRILNVDWDLFPVLFTVRPDLTYARGMDPGFDFLTEKRSIELFNALRSHREDIDWDTWLRDMIDVYPSNYIAFWTKRYRAATEQIETLPRTTRTSTNGPLAVFEVRQ